MESKNKKKVVIIGAGPAGLTAGLELLRSNNYQVTLVEKESVVGGLARTTEYKGCRYDIGPHHFITDSARVQSWWEAIMGHDFPAHKRFTRIYYNHHFFHYPLDPINVITGLKLTECARCILSYIKIRLFPIRKVKTFQDWVTNRFGYRLFSIFFKTYTEKVWGIPCEKISADWAAQRIKGFSLSKAIFYAFFGRFFKKNVPRTISDTFYYPSHGSGTMWEAVANAITTHPEGGNIVCDQDVIHIEHDDNRIIALSTASSTKKGETQKLDRHTGDQFFSTMPLRDLIAALEPAAPDHVQEAARSLQYRGLITVNLIVEKANINPDHWLYVHEKSVRMGRVGNMNNFSAKMTDSPNHTALSLEYFAFVGEPFWHTNDAELIKQGAQELEQIALVPASAVIDGMVMRTKDAYPVYNANYKQHLEMVLSYLAQFKNLHLMGRNGLHRYNNMDIAMLSAMHVVDELLKQEPSPIETVAKPKKKRASKQPTAP